MSFTPHNVFVEQESQWREQLRVCSLEIFPVYFRLTLSTGELANTQIKAIFGLAEDGNKLKDYLIGLTTLLTFLL